MTASSNSLSSSSAMIEDPTDKAARQARMSKALSEAYLRNQISELEGRVSKVDLVGGGEGAGGATTVREPGIGRSHHPGSERLREGPTQTGSPGPSRSLTSDQRVPSLFDTSTLNSSPRSRNRGARIGDAGSVGGPRGAARDLTGIMSDRQTSESPFNNNGGPRPGIIMMRPPSSSGPPHSPGPYGLGDVRKERSHQDRVGQEPLSGPGSRKDGPSGMRGCVVSCDGSPGPPRGIIQLPVRPASSGVPPHGYLGTHPHPHHHSHSQHPRHHPRPPPTGFEGDPPPGPPPQHHDPHHRDHLHLLPPRPPHHPLPPHAPPPSFGSGPGMLTLPPGLFPGRGGSANGPPGPPHHSRPLGPGPPHGHHRQGREDRYPNRDRDGRAENGTPIRLVVDVSMLMFGVGELRGMLKRGGAELVVPLEALRTLDLLKKGTHPYAVAARNATRFVEHALERTRARQVDGSDGSASAGVPKMRILGRDGTVSGDGNKEQLEAKAKKQAEVPTRSGLYIQGEEDRAPIALLDILGKASEEPKDSEERMDTSTSMPPPPEEKLPSYVQSVLQCAAYYRHRWQVPDGTPTLAVSSQELLRKEVVSLPKITMSEGHTEDTQHIDRYGIRAEGFELIKWAMRYGIGTKVARSRGQGVNG